MFDELTRRISRSGRGAAAVVLAGAVAAGAAVLASAGAASTLSTGTVQVQAFTVPAAAFATPLASPELPMAPDPSGDGEWFLVSGAASATLLDEPVAGGTPTVVTSNLSDNSGASPYLSMVSAGGTTWSEADNYGMLGLTSTGSVYPLPSLAKIFKPDARDMTADSNNNLYIPDHAGGDIYQANFVKIGGADWSLPNAFGTPKPEAVAFAGGQLWFTTDGAELGSINPSSGAFGGPYEEQPGGKTGPANGNAHTLAAGSDGDLWAVGGGQGEGTGGSDLLRIDPQSGAILDTYSTGLPPNPQITAITSGPDGNIWFTESGANEIGQLNLASGTITNYPLASGYQLPAAGADLIAAGPSSSGTVFFAAETTGSAPAIGEVSGAATSPAAGSTTTATTTTPRSGSTHTTGRLEISRRAKVNAKGDALVPIACRGSGTCSGRLSLFMIRKHRVRVRHRSVIRRITTKIGSARFRLKAGQSRNLTVRLSRAAVTAIAAATGRKLSVTAKLQPTGEKQRTARLTLDEPAKRRR
jgi:virginiamycin B lyase